MKIELLNVVDEIVKAKPYPGYPTERFTSFLLSKDKPVEIPDGPWVASNDELPTQDEVEKLIQAGYAVDTLGRPLHPWFFKMVNNLDVGVVTGKGKYRKWGPNFTVDPIVITRGPRRKILLIKRSDTGDWALPGGFVDDDENALESARRELQEEANFITLTEATKIYEGVVVSERTTAHAWAETTAYLFEIDKEVDVNGGDDATDAQWFYEDELPENLHGSHAFIIQLALESGRDNTMRDILTKPKESLEVTLINAGHMAYHHLLVSDGSTHLFIKVHDASRFTDLLREAHSRAYLEKEYLLLRHLSEQKYTAIPDHVDLIDDSILAMDAFRADEGWLWSAPSDDHLARRYIKDVIDSFDHLQTIKAPSLSQYHDDIGDTYTTFWKEGWDSMGDDNTVEVIIGKMRELSANWNNSQKVLVQDLISNLPALRKQAMSIDRNVELFMAHGDARQSNIAWHPDHGVKFVDWSWGDIAPKNADATMFVIDLVKSGFDMSDYTDHINRDQTMLLIGFWLAHSIWQTCDSDQTVREHQVASATAAYSILANFSNVPVERNSSTRLTRNLARPWLD